jgi:hypothetical protein
MYSTINGKAISDASYSELVEFFQEDIFFRFMDHGRQGIKDAASDVVDAMAVFLMQRNIPSTPYRDLTPDESEQVKKQAGVQITHHFIKSGSSGIREAIREIYSIVRSDMSNGRI